jgi:hypothetical protein
MSTITHDIYIAGILTIDDEVLSNVCLGSAFTPQTFTLTGGIGPYTWSDISSPPLPTGMSFDPSTQILSGTPTSIPAGGWDHVTVTLNVVSGDAQTATKTFNFIIYTNPIITNDPITLLDGIYLFSYSDFITSSLGAMSGFDTPAPTITGYSIVTGVLPTGLVLNTSTGEVHGTITSVSGYFAFTARVTDSHGCHGDQALSINVTETALSITTSSLPGSCRGASYDQTVVATDGVSPYTYSVSVGSLPPTLSLNTSTGEITGTVDVGATVQVYTFTIHVVDSTPGTPLTANRVLSVEVYGEPVWVTTTLPAGNLGNLYSQTLVATGGSLYNINIGSFPPGLDVDVSTGILSGTPTLEGVYPFTMTATSVHGCDNVADQAFSITIVEALPTVTGTFSNICKGATYYTHVTATGTPPLTYAITGGALPQSLTLGAVSGSVQGITAEAGDFTFDITVTDSLGLTGTNTFNFTVYDSPVINPPSLPPGVYGKPYQGYTFTYTGGTRPVTWVLYSTLPKGLIFNTIYGTITGTPLEFGYIDLDVGIQDANGCSYTFPDGFHPHLIVAGPPLIDGTIPMPPGCEGQAYSFYIIAVGGIPPYYYFITSDNYPPQNLVLNPYTGQLSGIPLMAGTYSFTVKVVDNNNLYVTKDYTLIIRTIQECGQADEADNITITKTRLASLESDPVFVVDPFHQRFLTEYLPLPFVLDDK